MNEKESHPLSDAAQQFFDTLIAFRAIAWVSGWLPITRWWQKVLVFCLAGIALFAALSALAREQVLVPIIAGFAFLFMALVLGHRTGLRVLEILREEIVRGSSLSHPHTAASDLLRRRAAYGRQIITSTVVVLLLLLVVTPASSRIFPGLTLVFWFAFATFFWFAAMNLLYFFIVITMTVLALVDEGLPLYPLDPSQSTFVHGATAIARQMVWLTSVTTAIGFLITPVIVSNYLEIALVTAFIVLVVVVLGVLALYALQQFSLSRIIARHKAQTMGDLQAQIQTLYAQINTLDQDERDRLRTLIELHDQVAARQERAITFMGALRFLSPLLLPLATILLNNLNSPVSRAIIDILNQLLQ